MPRYPPTAPAAVRELADSWENIEFLVGWLEHVTAESEHQIVIRSRLRMLKLKIERMANDLQETELRRCTLIRVADLKKKLADRGSTATITRRSIA